MGPKPGHGWPGALAMGAGAGTPVEIVLQNLGAKTFLIDHTGRKPAWWPKLLDQHETSKNYKKMNKKGDSLG